MTKLKRIESARDAVNKEIRGIASHGRIASALSSEGYAGGYYQALSDVLLLLTSGGAIPSTRNYWELPEKPTKP